MSRCLRGVGRVGVRKWFVNDATSDPVLGPGKSRPCRGDFLLVKATSQLFEYDGGSFSIERDLAAETEIIRQELETHGDYVKDKVSNKKCCKQYILPRERSGNRRWFIQVDSKIRGSPQLGDLLFDLDSRMCFGWEFCRQCWEPLTQDNCFEIPDAVIDLQNAQATPFTVYIYDGFGRDIQLLMSTPTSVLDNATVTQSGLVTTIDIARPNMDFDTNLVFTVGGVLYDVFITVPAVQANTRNLVIMIPQENVGFMLDTNTYRGLIGIAILNFNPLSTVSGVNGFVDLQQNANTPIELRLQPFNQQPPQGGEFDTSVETGVCYDAFLNIEPFVSQDNLITISQAGIESLLFEFGTLSFPASGTSLVSFIITREDSTPINDPDAVGDIFS